MKKFIAVVGLICAATSFAGEMEQRFQQAISADQSNMEKITKMLVSETLRAAAETMSGDLKVEVQPFKLDQYGQVRAIIFVENAEKICRFSMSTKAESDFAYGNVELCAKK